MNEWENTANFNTTDIGQISGQNGQLPHDGSGSTPEINIYSRPCALITQNGSIILTQNAMAIITGDLALD